MQLGKVLRTLAYTDSLYLGSAIPGGVDDVKVIASAIYGASLVVGLVLWGMGVFWLCIAVATIVDLIVGKRKDKGGGVPVNMGLWGFTFPLVSSPARLNRDLDRHVLAVCYAKITILTLILLLF